MGGEKNRLERCLLSPRRIWTSTGDQGRVLMKQAASGELYFIYKELISQSKYLMWAYKKHPWGKRRKWQGLPPYLRLLTDLLVILLEMCLGISENCTDQPVCCSWHRGQHCHRNFWLGKWKLEGGKKAMAAEFCFFSRLFVFCIFQ